MGDIVYFAALYSLLNIRAAVFDLKFSVLHSALRLLFFWDRLVSYSSIPVKRTEFKVLSSLQEISHLWPHFHQG